MDDADSSQGIRRSQREKKQAERFVAGGSTKRKRVDSGLDDAESPLSDIEEPEDGSGDEEHVNEEYRAPIAKPKAKASASDRKSKATTVRGSAAPKKSRAVKSAPPKAAKPTTRKSRKAPGGDHTFDPNQVALDSKISTDNHLFNAVINPAATLQSVAEDFLESLQQTPGAAQADLINMILRACGCNDSVDGDRVLDYDGVVDALDDFTEALKKDNSPIYPLTSKLPVFKKFRRSLSEILERLISSAAELGMLYTSDLMSTVQTWIIAMSSSQIRSFRHTSTVIALEMETALCDVAATVEKEAEVVGRQREGERKRKAANKGTGAAEKELEGRAARVRERRTKLAEFLKEFVDGVFIHRYRDFDPTIRAECVRAMGLWFKKHPGHFLDGAYLRYVGWVLSDSNTHVRLEAVNALSGVYDQSDYIGSLHHFTERFKPRLIEMARGDTELSVRVSVINVLEAIDRHSLLEDEEREKLCLLVFDEEAKVRKAVSGFVSGVWKETVDERLVGKKASSSDKDRAGVKALAMLLVKWEKALQKAEAPGNDASSTAEDEDVGPAEGSSRSVRTRPVPSNIGGGQKGRVGLVVEALWDEVEPVSNWVSLLDVLLLDHSAAGESAADGGLVRRKQGKKAVSDSVVDEAWRLDEVEESILLEVFVASLRRAKAQMAGVKKGEEETLISDMTRALIEGFPHLVIKYQTDQHRIANVLLIPPLMNLDLYLEMRMISAYANLWDDITKQFLSHSSTTVMTHAVAAVQYLLAATSLSNTNSTKILELEDELSTLLRDAVAGRDEIEVASFSEDEILSLTALCARLHILAGVRDLTGWTEEDEGGKQSSAWDIISALIDRGRLGYKEEEIMIEQALHFLSLHIMWKARRMSTDSEESPDAAKHRKILLEQREALLEKLVEYAVGTQSNTADAVKRAAFQDLMNLYSLFAPTETVENGRTVSAMASLSLTLDDEVQFRCAGFIQAEIERYAEDVLGESKKESDGDDPESSGESDDEPEENAREKTSKSKHNPSVRVPSSRSGLTQEYSFLGLISAFLRAIYVKAIHVRHCVVLLAHYGRLGTAFDSCAKAVVEVLRREAMIQDNGESVATIVAQALRESFSMLLDRVVDSEEHTVALAKALSPCFLVRGAQLAVVWRMDPKYVVQVHTSCLTWIATRLATYEKNKNKTSKKMAILFFRVLVPLLSSLKSDSAAAIKPHLDESLTQADIEVSATSKIWEPERAYEKRLHKMALKQKANGTKARKSKGGIKTSEFATSDEDTAGESGVESAPEANADDPIVVPRLRPRPRQVARAPAAEDGNFPAEQEGIDLDDGLENDLEALVTPRGRARPRTTYKSPAKSATKATPMSEVVANGQVTPASSRKRQFMEETGEPEQSDLAESRLSSPLSSVGSVADDIRFRRKRARR